MTSKIRRVKKGDKPALMVILRNTPEFKPSEVVVAEEVLDSYLHDPIRSGYHTLVAEIDATIVGYVCYGSTPLTEGTWDVYWIAVAPKKQGQGIGGALMAFAETQIKKARGRLVIIETSSQPEYEKTRRFYRSHDYEVVGRIPDFYAPGDDKLILQKRLK